MNTRAALAACALAHLVACDRNPAEERKVIFRERSLTIATLFEPVEPPLTAGSAKAGDLLVSSDPEVVAILDDGRLLARRNGSATVLCPASGSTLTVEVRQATGLAIEPAALQVSAGGQARVRAMADGVELPAEAVQWMMSDASVFTVRDGLVQAGVTPGTAQLAAKYGGVTAEAIVQVGTLRATRLALRARHSLLRVGDLEQLDCDAPAGLEPTWSSTRPAVLASLSNGLFQALRPGRAQVCAAVGETRRCLELAVAE